MVSQWWVHQTGGATEQQHTIPNRAGPLDHTVCPFSLHISDRDLGNEEEDAIGHVHDGPKSVLHGLQIPQVAADLGVLGALQHDGRTLDGLEGRERAAQLRGAQDGLALLLDQVGKVNVNELGPAPGALLRIAREALPREHVAAAPEIDDYLGLPVGPGTPEEVAYHDVDDMEPYVVPPVDEGGAALELLDEIAKEVRLVGVVQLLHAPLGDDAAAVRLR